MTHAWHTSWARGLRFAWATVSIILLECLLLGIALLPAAAFLVWQATWPLTLAGRTVVLAMAVVPLYLSFALLLILLSPLATALLGWRTPDGVEVPLNEFSWPVLDWGRYCMSIHVVRVFAGPAFRSTPFWSFYMRLNGATLGRLVWVNSLSLMDHNLLDFGDGVVIGSDAHVSGHIVEHGLLRTARVVLGPRTVIGTGSVVGIGVRTGAGTHVGALSVVPKFSALEGETTYAGVPIHQTSPRRPPPAQ
jgi:acetyltransferase-like isoleucine patch superfamily enzyme